MVRSSWRHAPDCRSVSVRFRLRSWLTWHVMRPPRYVAPPEPARNDRSREHPHGRSRTSRRSTTWSRCSTSRPIEVNIFRGASTDEDRVRVFGGQVAGQALIAASRTDRRAGPPRPLVARLLPPSGRPEEVRSCTRSTASVTAAASQRAVSSRSSTARRSSICRPASTTKSPTARTTTSRWTPGSAGPKNSRTSTPGWPRTRIASDTGTTAPARSTCGTSTATR